MATTMHSTNSAPLTEDAFIADRQRFWGSFTHATTFAVVAMVILLILMTIFLV